MINLLLFFPTLLWALGYIEFHSQILFFGATDRTIGWSVYLSFLVAIAYAWQRRDLLSFQLFELYKEWRAQPLLLQLLAIVCTAMFAFASLAAKQPPHMMQEFDAINYHMSLPRQHLLAGTLGHLQWSVADLFPMPLQFGLAPFWFMGEYFHKIPQLLFALWAFFLLAALGKLCFNQSQSQSQSQFKLGSTWSWIPALAFFTTHGVMIQLGTAMLDLANLYFLLAFFYAAKVQKYALAALHLSVFMAAKAFLPFQVIAIAVVIIGIYFVWDRKLLLVKLQQYQKIFLFSFLFLGILLARSAWLGVERAGSPTFPFGSCIFASKYCEGEDRQRLDKVQEVLWHGKEMYGSGRDPLTFLSHLWQVAVPNKSLRVNNVYDYPLGFSWLLWLVFFALFLWQFKQDKKLSLYMLVALGFWFSWWFGSQQSRWLYPTMAFGLLATMNVQQRIKPFVLHSVLLMAALLSFVSEFRALRHSIFMSPPEIYTRVKGSIRVDPATKLMESRELLYVDEVIQKHASKDRGWVFDLQDQ